MAFPPSKARYPGGPAAAAPVAPAPSAGADADGAAKRSSFKVLKALGKGSYGTVYKVQRIQDEQFYALKETDLGSMNQNERADSVNEVRLLVSIDHPNVIRYNEAFLNGNKLCVVMEYAPYGDLKRYIDKGVRMAAPFPEEIVWRIFMQLVLGIQGLHAAAIIHRDIKPANIFICENDILKIGDLGIAKAMKNMNYAKTQIGTPCYMAPEVWMGRPYTNACDLWSLGCVLYELLMFSPPFGGATMNELKARVLAGRFKPVPAGKYSPELINLCHSLLSQDPRQRPTCDTMMATAVCQKWMRVVPRVLQAAVASGAAAPKPDANLNLMATIQVPRDLRQLPMNLPPPSYDNNPLKEHINKMQQQQQQQQAGAKPAAPAPAARPPSSGGGVQTVAAAAAAAAAGARPGSAGPAAAYNRKPVAAAAAPSAAARPAAGLPAIKEFAPGRGIAIGGQKENRLPAAAPMAAPGPGYAAAFAGRPYH